MKKAILDVGCGSDKTAGAIGIDKIQLPGVDIVHDLDLIPWPLAKESFDEIYMLDVIEHMQDVVAVINECYRLLKKDGKLFIKVVYWNHKYAWSDSTHIRAFSERSFLPFAGQERAYYSSNHFSDIKISYIFDSAIPNILRKKKILVFLSKYLCNIVQGINVTFIK